MKKTTLIKNKRKTENFEWQNEIAADGTIYPPLFCHHTWTKSVPICVTYLLLIATIFQSNKNEFYLHYSIEFIK